MILENYLKHIQEAGEQSFQMYKRYGTVALLTVSPSTIYNYIFKQIKSSCTRGCRTFQLDPACWYSCYIKGVAAVVSAIGRDVGRVNSIPDSNQREKLRASLQNELDRWQQKQEKLKEKLVAARGKK